MKYETAKELVDLITDITYEMSYLKGVSNSRVEDEPECEFLKKENSKIKFVLDKLHFLRDELDLEKEALLEIELQNKYDELKLAESEGSI